MKDQVLSIEQMQKLKQLGLDTSNASMVRIFTDGDCNELDWEDIYFNSKEIECYLNEDGQEHLAYESLLDAETGDYDHSYRKECGVFTLQDILDILQKVKYNAFGFPMLMIAFIPNFNQWSVSFRNPIDFENPKIECKCLLEASYQMLLWCLENNHIKTNE